MLTVAAAPLPPLYSFDIPLRRSIVAAISGGSDSTALLLLLRDHLAAAAPTARLIAATVDHGLRAESAAEAEAVARLCASFGIEHRTLTWTGEKPASGIPAAAREARYRLLAEAAREAGTDLVFTGHTADDQLETVAMRKERRGDGRGLAGMAPATLYAGDVWICRPLLGTRRDVLRDYLRRQNIGWIDDPTNVDRTYERPRMREAMTTASDNLAAEAALLEVVEAGAEREALGVQATHLITAHAERDPSGVVLLEPAFAAFGDTAAATYALRLLLATVGGSEHLPDHERSAALFARLGEPGLRATLSRCVVENRKDGLRIRREKRAGTPIPARAQPTVAPFARFLPSFDLAPAAALAALVGAPPLPPPPFS